MRPCRVLISTASAWPGQPGGLQNQPRDPHIFWQEQGSRDKTFPSINHKSWAGYSLTKHTACRQPRKLQHGAGKGRAKRTHCATRLGCQIEKGKSLATEHGGAWAGGAICEPATKRCQQLSQSPDSSSGSHFPPHFFLSPTSLAMPQSAQSQLCQGQPPTPYTGVCSQLV